MVLKSSAQPDRRTVAQLHVHPRSAGDYSAYVPVQVGHLRTVAYIDSGNTFANVISPAVMKSLGIQLEQLEPVPQLSVGTAAKGKSMKILGQAPRITLQFPGHPAKFRIRPLVLQGLVHPVNICGPFLAREKIDQIHSRKTLRVMGKEIPMCRKKTTSARWKFQPRLTAHLLGNPKGRSTSSDPAMMCISTPTASKSSR